MALDVGRLRVLVEVAHAGSIAAAARRMTFTPSALSQQLSKLERELGCPLVERGRAGVRLTAAGAVLVEYGERVLGELRDAEAAVRVASEAKPVRLAIGSFPSASKVLLPKALAVLRERHPEVELSLIGLEPPDGYGLVVSRDLDLLVTHRYPGVPPAPAGGLERQSLIRDRLRLVLPSGHPRASASGRSVPLAELAGEHWISGPSGMANRVCLETLAVGAGIEPHVSYETSDYETTLALVGVGLGISLVPTTMIREVRRPGLVVSELASVRPAREIYTVHRKQRPPLVGELVTLLRGIAKAAIR